jgi:hypothetical protein
LIYFIYYEILVEHYKTPQLKSQGVRATFRGYL